MSWVVSSRAIDRLKAYSADLMITAPVQWSAIFFLMLNFNVKFEKTHLVSLMIAASYWKARIVTI